MGFQTRNFILIIFFISFCSLQDVLAQQDSINSKRIKYSIYPVIGYQPETSLMLGAIGFIVYNKPGPETAEHYRPSNISPYILYTLNNQMLIAIDMELYLKNNFSLEITPRFFKYPDFFFGVGNNNKLDDEEIYTNVFQQLDGAFMKFIDSRWSTGLRFDLQHNKLHDLVENGLLANSGLTGLNGGFNIGLGPVAQFDSRDNILYPGKGTYARSEINFYAKAWGGDFNYTLFKIDLRKYFSIKSDKNILAFQAVGNFMSGDEVPFYKLQKIGGDVRLRGIANENLYIDKQSFWVQAEYRRDLFWRFGGVAFAGLGDVAPTIDKFVFDELKYVIGLGGRFQALKDEKLNARLDVGIGRGGQHAVYLSIKEAF